MHVDNGISPYTSSEDAISKFPETATALGVKLDGIDRVILTAPHGIQDAVNVTIKPTPFFMETKERMYMYDKRVRKKNWNTIWSMVRVHDIDLEINGESRKEY